MTGSFFAALALVAASPLAAVPVLLNNAGFQADSNSSPSGLFASGDQESVPGVLSGWSIIATDNTSTDNTEVAVGWANLTPPEGTQALSLMAGAAIAQQTSLPWTSLSPGDVLTLTVAAGDRNTGSTANPRWADNSFFGLSDGLATRLGAPPATPGSSTTTPSPWIGKQVAWKQVTTPPGGFKSGTMGDVTLTHTVTAADVLRSGAVGVFIASLGNRDYTTNGTSGGSAQSFWDHVRLDLVSAPGPTIQSFTSDATVLENGENATLAWSVDNATSVTLNPSPGTVSASGSQVVTPPGTTTYTLTAANQEGSKSRVLTISTRGPAVYRYFRFTPTLLRGGASADSVQISEFQMLLEAVPLVATSAANPGGNSPGGENPSMAIDGNLNTKWLDFNKAPLVLDYGQPVTATAYRFATANDGTERDPVSWRLEGSQNGTTWELVDERANQTVTTDRKTWLAGMPTLANGSYPLVPGSPVIDSFASTPATITEGAAATVSWSVTGATSVMLFPGGSMPASGSLEVAPRATTQYILVATNAQGSSFATASVIVNLLPRGSITASAADAEFHTAPDGSVLAGPLSSEFEILDVGRQSFGDEIRHVVIPFQLPSLGTGGFLRAELEVYPYIGGALQQSRTPVNLFAIPGARVSATPLATDVNNGTNNHLSRGYLMDASFLNASTPFEQFTGSGEYSQTAEALGYWLNEAYANGANAGKYVFLRLSPDALQLAEGLGFGIGTADASGDTKPSLSYVFNPAGVSNVPVIGAFEVTPRFVEAGQPATLSWSTLGASSVEISPGIGSVSSSASVMVSPSVTTLYTITATNGFGNRTSTTTLTVVPPGAYRYFRFTTLAVRGPDSQALNLGELQVLQGGIPHPGGSASAPGSNNLLGGSLSNLTDGNPSSNWLDLAKAPILLDFGTQVVAGSYRFATSGLDSWDPVSWRFEASRDGISWTLLDEQFGFGTPAEDGFIPAIILTELPPPVDFRVTGITFVGGGSTVRLVWNSQAGATYRIETSPTLLANSWITAASGIPSAGASTTRDLARGTAATLFYRIVRE